MSKLYSRLLGLGALLGMVSAGPVQAQTTRPNRCGTEEANALQQAELQRLNPGYNPARSTNTARPISAARTTVQYTLPIVFHIIHNGEAVGLGSNITQAQIQSQLDVLNEDYRNLNPDGATVVPTVYQPRRADAQVQFVMAQRDPNGNTMPEPGIDRVNRNTKGFTAPPYTMAYNQSTVKPQTYWNPEQYINIWVENLGGGLLGYAQFPDNNAGLGGLNPSGGAANTDGVVILYGACGSRAKYAAGTYATNYDRGRTLTHELGHWFSLRHIWGDANCGNDYCNDTPTQQTANYGCVTFPQVTCGNGTGDMSQNYMDYSDDRCMAMFSADQVSRVQAVMAAGTPRRTNLVNSPAICQTSLALTAGSNSPVCVGGSLNLTATSTNAPAGSTYAWTGPNGFTSTLANPTLTNVTAAAAGTYRVTITGPNSTYCPGTATVAVVVNPTPPVPGLTSSVPSGGICAGSTATLSTTAVTPTATLPGTDFNSGLPAGWDIASTGAAGTTWQVSAGNTVSFGGNIGVSNFTLNGSRFAYANSDAGGAGSITNTTLTAPAFSTVGYSALSVAFQQVLFPNVGTSAVEISTNGTTWTALASYSNTQGGINGGVAAPVTTTISLPAAYLNQPSVRVRWHYIDTSGYLWAIDNVVFTGTAPSYTYSWSLVSGDGLPATTTTPSITVTPTQNSVYRLTLGYAGNACTSSATVAVNVNPLPAVPALTAAASSVCAGASTQLSVSNPAGAGFTYSYSLVSGDGLPGTNGTAGITVTPTQNSVYRLTVTNASTGCSSSATVAVGVIPAPAKPTAATSQSLLCGGGTATLTGGNLPTGTGYTYQWQVVANPDGTTGNGLPATANTASITVSPTTTTSYVLKVTNSCGASATSDPVVVTAVTNSIQAYPVPFGDGGLTLAVSTCTAGPVAVQLFDSMGRRVYDQVVQNVPVGNNVLLLPGSQHLAGGKYTLKVQQGSQNLTFNVVRQ